MLPEPSTKRSTSADFVHFAGGISSWERGLIINILLYVINMELGFFPQKIAPRDDFLQIYKYRHFSPEALIIKDDYVECG